MSAAAAAFQTLAAEGQTFAFNVGQRVPDGSGSGLASARTVSGPIRGSRVKVGLTIAGVGAGMVNGDLFASLSHENAAGLVDGYVVLLNRPGRRSGDDEGYRDNGLSVTFSGDAGMPDIHSYRVVVTGSHTVPLGGALSGVWSPDSREVDPDAVLDSDPRGRSLEVFNSVDPSDGRWVLFVADLVTGGEAKLESWSLEFTPGPAVTPRVVGRHVFYNQSGFDGGDAAANAADDAALATDKAALLPCAKATFANYTSFSRGLNGLMVDISGLPGTPTAADFGVRVGNTNDLSQWVVGPVPASVAVRAGAGVGGSDRVTVVWGADAPKKQWLELTVRANARSGLAEPDVFYFGNAIGETGNSGANAWVTSVDALRVLQNVSLSAAVDSRFDLNRDGRVGAADRLLVLANLSAVAPLILLDLTCMPGDLADSAEGGNRVAAGTARRPVLSGLQRTAEGLHARWVSDGLPVVLWTTDDLLKGVWEPFETIPGVPPAGQELEFPLPAEPEGSARFYRLEAGPLR